VQEPKGFVNQATQTYTEKPLVMRECGTDNPSMDLLREAEADKSKKMGMNN
jgi:hypothetical protein